jgi:hypothetical protein
LRDTIPATQLLDVLGFGRLNGLRFRMSTARPTTGTRDPAHGRSRTFGTVCALSTLLCWPGHARVELVTGAARAATATLQHRRVVAQAEAALALRWVAALGGCAGGAVRRRSDGAGPAAGEAALVRRW